MRGVLGFGVESRDKLKERGRRARTSSARGRFGEWGFGSVCMESLSEVNEASLRAGISAMVCLCGDVGVAGERRKRARGRWRRAALQLRAREAEAR